MGDVSAPHGPPGVEAPGARTWQKVGWVLLALFVAAGATGLLGHGPLSHASLERGDLRIDYERVLRARAPTEIRIAVARGAPARLELAVETDDPDDIELQAIVPEPLRERASARGRVFELATHGGALRVALRGMPRQVGGSRTHLTLAGGDPVAIRQLVLP